MLDLIGRDSTWTWWSAAQLRAARLAGPILINQIVLAELTAGAVTERAILDALDERRIEREDLPWEAAFLAGKAYLSYRRRGGDKRSPLPDFYIGAHAAAKGYVLLTRDIRRYRVYFPALTIIAPDATEPGSTP